MRTFLHVHTSTSQIEINICENISVWPGGRHSQVALEQVLEKPLCTPPTLLERQGTGYLVKKIMHHKPNTHTITVPTGGHVSLNTCRHIVNALYNVTLFRIHTTTCAYQGNKSSGRVSTRTKQKRSDESIELLDRRVETKKEVSVWEFGDVAIYPLLNQLRRISIRPAGHSLPWEPLTYCRGHVIH